MTILVWAGHYQQARDAMERVGRPVHTWRSIKAPWELHGRAPGTVVVKCGTWWSRPDAGDIERECFARRLLVVNLQEYMQHGQSIQGAQGGRRDPQDYATKAVRAGYQYAADVGRILDTKAHAPGPVVNIKVNEAAVSQARLCVEGFRAAYPHAVSAWEYTQGAHLTDAEFWDELATHIEEGNTVPGGRGLCKALRDAVREEVITLKQFDRLKAQAQRNKPADARAGYWWPTEDQGGMWEPHIRHGKRRRAAFCRAMAADSRSREADKTAGDNVQRYRP